MLPSTQTYSLVPQSIEDAMKLAISFSKSNCVPNEYRNKPENTLIAILMGLEVGLKPTQAVQGIAVINGRPCIWGDTIMGLVKASGQLEYILETLEGDLKTNAVATCVMKRRNEKYEVIRTFSVEDAKRSGLWSKDNYQKFPECMLPRRAKWRAANACFPDVLKGLYIREEVEDYSLEKEVSPVKKDHLLLEDLQAQLNAENPIKLPTMPMGQYQGKPMDKISSEYLQGILTNEKVPLDIKELAANELARRNH